MIKAEVEIEPVANGFIIKDRGPNMEGGQSVLYVARNANELAGIIYDLAKEDEEEIIPTTEPVQPTDVTIVGPNGEKLWIPRSILELGSHAFELYHKEDD